MRFATDSRRFHANIRDKPVFEKMVLEYGEEVIKIIICSCGHS